MAINYTTDEKFRILGELLKQYQAWFSGLVLHVFHGAAARPPPDVFINWVKTVSFEKIDIEGRYAREKDRLLLLHNELMQEAPLLTKHTTPGGFEAFSEKFRAFLAATHNFCQSVVIEQGGLDIFTGLKNKAVLRGDINIEMERLAREGFPFSLGLARIDDFKIMEKSLGSKNADAIVKTVADFILKSLRTYDDAYRISRDHFVLCLKQSDTMGGQRALERLRDILEEAGKVYNIDGRDKLLTMSCCVASPFPGDDINDLFDNLYVDLDKQIKDPGSVLTYQALSPLQRFIKEDR
jgi:diguanylate cyclase (GGDEF)-like protein